MSCNRDAGSLLPQLPPPPRPVSASLEDWAGVRLTDTGIREETKPGVRGGESSRPGRDEQPGCGWGCGSAMNLHGRPGRGAEEPDSHAACKERAAASILGPHYWQRCPPDVCPEQQSAASRSSSILMLTAVFGLLLLSLIHLGQEAAQPAGGAAGELCPTVLLLRCAVYLGGALCALVVGSLCALHCAGRQAAPPDFTRARSQTQMLHSVNLHEAAQPRRVAICHSMDKALKEATV
ncbi:hypothetical protein GDO78_011734 [Eleutherodactylus coqui]|uniref:Uncharacterized protein n=1 Tax=Eleutherodactylus coqui TaxID=57060 RepID=A0A8J6F2G7_ELECQ|nr:hypothetical protein GDO78_011734 [Eleutherodactylus coqui]